jgi:transposase
MRRYALRDDQWARIEGLLPGRVGHVGMTARDNRLFVEAVLYRYRAGIPWRDLPDRFGSWKAVHTRFGRWARGGVWERVLQHLAADADTEYAMLDSTVVRAHQHSAGAHKKILWGTGWPSVRRLGSGHQDREFPAWTRHLPPPRSLRLPHPRRCSSPWS